MKETFLMILILIALFLTGNAVHAYFMEIDGVAGHYFSIDGGANILLIDGADPAGAPPRGRGLSKTGTGLKL